MKYLVQFVKKLRENKEDWRGNELLPYPFRDTESLLLKRALGRLPQKTQEEIAEEVLQVLKEYQEMKDGEREEYSVDWDDKPEVKINAK